MAKLEKIWIKEADDVSPAEIRVDWDNDSHQAVKIKGSDPQALMDALKQLERILYARAFTGEI